MLLYVVPSSANHKTAFRILSNSSFTDSTIRLTARPFLKSSVNKQQIKNISIHELKKLLALGK
jgi:hypothetical protein